jgi:hypothetical protein
MILDVSSALGKDEGGLRWFFAKKIQEMVDIPLVSTKYKRDKH